MKFKIIQNQQTPKVEICKDVETLLDEDYKFLDKFISFARRQYNCAGLAANQVSCDGHRVMYPFFAIKTNHHWDLIIAPKITKYWDKGEYKIERCLTWLGENIKAMRHPKISASYLNLKGEHISRKISGFEAQVWQHEYNHLMGIEEEFV